MTSFACYCDNKSNKIVYIKGKNNMKEDLILNNLSIYGNNIKDDNPTIFIANHTCIRDVFYILKAINKKTIVLTSSNSVYKQAPKEDFMKKHLYMLPIEIYGDSRYTNLIIEKSIYLLSKKQNIIIFPEGVYSIDKNINRAHTVASRIILKALENDIDVHLIPISIKIIGEEKDKASINFDNEQCFVHILPEIETKEYLEKYQKANTREERNKIFHELMDNTMYSIANDLNVNYRTNYRPYVKKEQIFTLNGKRQDINILKTDNYYKKYKIDLESRLQNIVEENNKSI